MIICLLIPLGAASASDINTTTADDQVLSATPQVDTLSTGVNLGNENDTLSVQSDENLLSARIDNLGSNEILRESNDDYGSFTDLARLISLSGDTVILNQNYEYKTDDVGYSSGITLSRPLTIIGNNHIISGSDQKRVFTITGDNVIIKNLTFIKSPKTIQVDGNNVQLINCSFINITELSSSQTSALCVEWLGANGTITDSTFHKIDYYNTGSQRLGIIYCPGSLDISNSYFSNVTANLDKNSNRYWGLAISIPSSSLGVTVRDCTFENFTGGKSVNGAVHSASGLIYSQRKNINVSQCEFININLHSSASSSYGFFGEPTELYVNDCNFIGCNIDRISKSGYVIFNNINFYDTKFYYDCLGYNANYLLVNNCTFDCGDKDIILGDSNGGKIEVYNSRFNNLQNGYAINQKVLSSLIVDSCNFTDINLTNSAPINLVTGDNIVQNCRFDNTTGTNALGINVSPNARLNNASNVFTNKPTTLPEINGNINNFTFYNEFYVKNSTSVFSDKNMTVKVGDSLQWALEKIYSQGTIYIYDDEYNLEDKQYEIISNIKGMGNNVVINYGSFKLTVQNLYIDNIIFNNTKSYFTLIKSQFKNSKFKNIDCSSDYFIQNSYGRIADLYNLTFIDSNFNSLVYVTEHNTLDMLNITNCNITNAVFYGDNFANDVSFKNINITDSKLNNFYYKISEQNNYAKFYNITVSNNVITGNIMDKWGNNYDFNGVKIIDNDFSSSTSDYLFYMGNGFTFNNITVNNISTLKKIFSGSYNFVLSNSTFEGINADYLVENQKAGSLDNITIKNSSFNSLLNNYVKGDIFYKLNVSDSNFTSGIIFKLLDDMVLDNSIFTNYTGHIIITGSKITVKNSNFSKARNNDLNGSSLLLEKGNQIKILYCNFTDNIAGNGTLYIHKNVERPVINYCNFTNNNADNGGAIYIVSTPSDKATIGINPSTNKTILYPNQDKYEYGYNDFYGYLSDIYSVLYLVNNTDDWNPDNEHDGKTYETATSNLALLNSLIDSANVYFVRPNDVFNVDNEYTLEYSDVTFHGLNTTLKSMSLIISDTSSDFKAYNITFEGYTDTAVIVNASGCLFDNCSFINNGGENTIYGGALQINANNTKILNSSFVNNKATHKNAEGIFDSVGGAIYINSTNVNIEDCYFKDNVVSNTGSSVYFDKSCEHIILKDNNFTFGSISKIGAGNGASVVVQGVNIIIMGNNFTNNTGYVGSAVNIIGDVSLLTLKENNFTNNSANEDGGALYLAFTNSLKANNVIIINNFNNNSAVNGGALFVDTSYWDSFTMNTNNYINNTAVNGGAVYINCPGFVLSDGVLVNNSATVGGAVYVNATNVLFKDLEFTGNKAITESSMGSAIYVADDVDCNFDNVKLDYNQVYGENDTSTSGGLRGDIYFADIVSATVDNVVFGDNPYKQYYAVDTMYRAMSIYVNLTGTGRGLSVSDTRSTLDVALNHIAPNGIIYFMDDNEFEITAELYKQIQEANLTNVTFASVGNKILKKSTDNKYLFILQFGKNNIKTKFNNHDKILNKRIDCKFQ